MTVVYNGGTFDLLHPGHIALLRGCRRIAGKDGFVVIALNTDEFIERFKGKKPVQSFSDRKIMLESTKYVDYVIDNFGEEDSKKTIEAVPASLDHRFRLGFAPKVDIVVTGTDWACRDYYGQMQFTAEWLDENDIVLLYLDRRDPHSSTQLKEDIRK